MPKPPVKRGKITIIEPTGYGILKKSGNENIGTQFYELIEVAFNEKRGDKYYSRSVPVFSNRLNLYGVADIVEFLRDDSGVDIKTQKGLWRINPIEYKNGKPEKSGADALQLCAVAICLEEMFQTEIPSGEVYYGKLRRRINVPLTAELRSQLEVIIKEINALLDSAVIPPKPDNQNCSLCSLANICVPSIFDFKDSNTVRINRLMKGRS
jgi:CRISPR-associated exonuclease Cas4